MNRVLQLLFALGLMLGAEGALAQTASATGKSDTTCVQTNSTTLQCTTVTNLTIPPVSLATMSLPAGTIPGPACTGLTARTSTQIALNTPTDISLSVNGCPSSGAYTFKWGAPVSATTTVPTTTHSVTLFASAPSQNYSVDVCFTNNLQVCSTYTTSVSAVAPPPPLACTVGAASSSVTSGTSNQLTVNCTSGNAANSGITYQWYRGPTLTPSNLIPGAKDVTFTVPAGDTTTTAANLTYSVEISNGAPSTVALSVSFAVKPPVAAVTDYCPSSPVRAAFNASQNFQRYFTNQIANTPPSGYFVLAIDVTASDSTVGRYLAEINFSDAGASRSGRYVTLSKSKCDFTDAAQWISTNVGGVKSAENAGGGGVALGGDTRPANAILTPGRWYINIQNVPGYCLPNLPSCDTVITWSN